MQIRGFHLLIGSLAVAAVGYFAANGFNATLDDTPQAAVASRQSTDEARLARLESALSSLSAARAPEGPGARPPESSGDHPRSRLPPTMLTSADQQSLPTEELLEATEHQEREVLALLDNAVITERTDPHWSISAAEEISTGLPSATMENSQVSDVRCQTSLCRIQATHANVSSEHEFMMSLGQLSSFRNGEAFLTRTPREDGRMATTIFISRAGQRLPALH